MTYTLDLTLVGNNLTFDSADQKLVITNSPAAFSVQIDNGDVLTVPAGRTGTITRADGQPLGKVRLVALVAAAGQTAQVYVNDKYCVDLY